MTEFNRVMTEEEEDTERDRYLTFMLGEEAYCMEISVITEIIGILPITKIPELPAYARGIVNLRGKIIPVVDVRLRLNKPEREYDGRTCVIVVDIGEMPAGLIVDQVAEVDTIPPADISLPADITKNPYISGIGKVKTEVKLILDCKRLFGNEIAL